MNPVDSNSSVNIAIHKARKGGRWRFLVDFCFMG
jgi:hypothetical protein